MKRRRPSFWRTCPDPALRVLTSLERRTALLADGPVRRRDTSWQAGRRPRKTGGRTSTGYTPFTLAAVIAGLLAAAELAERSGRADGRGGSSERPPTPGTPPSKAGSTSLTPNWPFAPVSKAIICGRFPTCAGPKGPHPGSGRQVDEDASPSGGVRVTRSRQPRRTGLVPFGLRSPNNPRIVTTVKAIDFLLKVDTPRGTAWRRYNGDRYGERPNGSPYRNHPGAESAGPGRSWRASGGTTSWRRAAGRGRPPAPDT